MAPLAAEALPKVNVENMTLEFLRANCLPRVGVPIGYSIRIVHEPQRGKRSPLWIGFYSQNWRQNSIVSGERKAMAYGGKIKGRTCQNTLNHILHWL